MVTMSFSLMLPRPPRSTLSLHDALPICPNGEKKVSSAELAQAINENGEAALFMPTYDEVVRSEEHTSELQSRRDLVCRLLLEKKNERRRPHGAAIVALEQHALAAIGEPI